MSLPVKPAWMAHAACHGTTGLFYPDTGVNVDAARRICWDECPVQRDCLLHALTTGERFGVWGGYSERQRRRIRANPTERAFAFARIELKQRRTA